MKKFSLILSESDWLSRQPLRAKQHLVNHMNPVALAGIAKCK